MFKPKYSISDLLLANIKRIAELSVRFEPVQAF